MMKGCSLLFRRRISGLLISEEAVRRMTWIHLHQAHRLREKQDDLKHRRAHTHTHTHTDTRHPYIHTHTVMTGTYCTHKHTQKHARTHARTHAHAHTHTHTHTHTHERTQAHA